jgi:hypothetical protein
LAEAVDVMISIFLFICFKKELTILLEIPGNTENKPEKNDVIAVS